MSIMVNEEDHLRFQVIHSGLELQKAYEVLDSFECGIGIEGMHDFLEHDIIEVFEIKEIKRKLN